MKILIDEEVVKQALDVLLDIRDFRPHDRCNKAITTLRSALQAEKVEPVAWMIVTNNKNVPDRHDSWLTFDIAEFKHNSAPCLTIAEVTPLYSQQSDTRIEREMK